MSSNGLNSEGEACGVYAEHMRVDVRWIVECLTPDGDAVGCAVVEAAQEVQQSVARASSSGTTAL